MGKEEIKNLESELIRLGLIKINAEKALAKIKKSRLYKKYVGYYSDLRDTK